MRDVSPPNTGRSIEEARFRSSFYDVQSDLPPKWFAIAIVAVFGIMFFLALWALLALAGV